MLRTRLVVSAVAALAGCSSLQPQADRLLGVITPYRIDIMQGNVVTKELAEMVKPGMTREQVRDLLGSPLLVVNSRLRAKLRARDADLASAPGRAALV